MSQTKFFARPSAAPAEEKCPSDFGRFWPPFWNNHLLLLYLNNKYSGGLGVVKHPN